MPDLSEHLQVCIERSLAGESALPPELTAQLGTFGMSGAKGRALLNNICQMPGTRYLEIGIWQGSTFFSALHGNSIRAVGIDNWSEYDGRKAKEFFQSVFNQFIGANQVSVLDVDCWQYFPQERFNVYFYDGGHSTLDQYRALAHFGPFMDDEFIMLVDDHNSHEVHEGTEMAINDLGYEILHQRVLGSDGGHTDADGWWNGCLALVLRRPER